MNRQSETERFGEFTTLERRGRIVVATFDRGDGLNALSTGLMRELTELADHLAADTVSSAIVLTGHRAFSAGADLKERASGGGRSREREQSRMREEPALWERSPDRDASCRSDRLLAASRPDRDQEIAPTGEIAPTAATSPTLLERRQALKRGPDMCAAWERLEQITIAAVERFCIGGGVALAIACDHRIAGAGAHFRLPEIPLGMNMSWQSNPRTVALMGPSRAKRFTILGEKLDAAAALDWGLVDEVTADGAALPAALALAARYAAMPPIPLRMTKQAINAAAGALNYATSYMDRDQFLLASMSADQQEGVRAFLEKRDPEFRGD